MRVVLFTESLGAGGAERQLCGLAILLQEAGHEVKVITYVDRPFYAHSLREHGVGHELHPELRNKYLRPLRLARLLRRHSPEAVISYLSSCNMAACLARIFGRHRLIVSERNTSQTATLKERILFHLYRLADYVVPNSCAQTRFIESNYPFLTGRLRTITNFVDTAYFSPAERSSCNGEIHILTVARLMPQKNCLRYIEVIRRIKERGLKVRFDWYGDGCSEEYQRQIEQKIVSENVSEIFTLHPATSEIRAVYRSADVFCLPSLYEGYPNVVCEAMSCGLPVLCSRVCDNPSIVAEGRGGYLFDPQDTDEMVEAIVRFCDLSADERKNMGAFNTRHIQDRCSKDVFLKKYQRLLDPLATQPVASLD